jgi:uncharacterized membrane protein
MVFGSQGQKNIPGRFRLSDRAFLGLAIAFFGVIVFGLVEISSIFMSSDWTTYDMQRFFAMAEVIVNGATPYLDYQDPKPPLIYFTLALPVILGQKLLGGLILVGVCDLASAILVMLMAWKLYGRFSGFLAGLLFTANIAWAQGYFIFTEPFALAFILLSTYVLVFTDWDKRYVLSGLFTGIAIGFKQYALLLIPLLLFYMYRKGELKKAPGMLAGALLPLLVIFAAILLIYGSQALSVSLYWSFGVAGTYMTQSDMGGVSSYRTDNPLILAANLVLAVSIFTSLLIFAVASFLHDRPVTPLDEYFFLAAIAFSATILVRQYLHYWILALPFIALLCARPFRDRLAEACGEKSEPKVIDLVK